jgi:DNA polymerase I-like protein with 3'-5' exonuclease and polymerase domains
MLGEELEKRKMKTVPVLQVHDSILFDVVEEEKDELMEMINFVGTNKEHLGLRNDVLLQIEWEEGINWLEMKEVKS